MTDMEYVIERAARTIHAGHCCPCDSGGCDEPDPADYNAARALAEAGYLTTAITRDDIDRALINVTSNAMNYPTPSQMLGKDSGPLRRKCVDAVCSLFGIEEYGVLND